jgi:competence protein ComEA
VFRKIYHYLFSNNKIETRGFITLGVFIAIYLIVSFYPYPNKPFNNDEEERINAIITSSYSNQKNSSNNSATKIPIADFDPNAIDSVTLIQYGISKRTVRQWINWRKKGKIYKSIEDIAAIYAIQPEELEGIKKHLIFKNQQPTTYNTNTYKSTDYIKEASSPFELNTATEAQLESLKGVGSVLAKKITQYRIALGGFKRHQQLLEIYKFHDTTYAYFKKMLLIDSTKIKKIAINQISEEQLILHPYIGTTMAKDIIRYRNDIGKFQNMQQLKEVPLMNAEKYRKIAEYCIID